MTTYILQMILGVSAITMGFLLFRASAKVASLSEEEINSFSINPYLLSFTQTLTKIVKELLYSISKKFLHLVANLSKHAHRFSTYSIAHMEKKKEKTENEEKKLEE